MFDVQRTLDELQGALIRRDREAIEDLVSDRMIWILPTRGNARGKRDWIEASSGVTWLWFRVEVLRTIALDDVVIVESLISQSREPTVEEGVRGPVTAEGIVVDTWAIEEEKWRLVARHPHRIE